MTLVYLYVWMCARLRDSRQAEHLGEFLRHGLCVVTIAVILIVTVVTIVVILIVTIAGSSSVSRCSLTTTPQA